MPDKQEMLNKKSHLFHCYSINIDLINSFKYFHSHECYQEPGLPRILLCFELPLGRVFHSVKHLDSYESRSLLWLLGKKKKTWFLQLQNTHLLIFCMAKFLPSREKACFHSYSNLC